MNNEALNIFDEEIDQKGQFLTFLLENEAYGIWIGYVTEIIGILPYMEVPELPNYLRGIINLRGRIIPIMDMRLRFGKHFVDYDERTCIIVVDIEEDTVGFIVDSVSEVVTIDDDKIIEQPMMSTGISNQFVKSIGKVADEVKLLLDCEKVLRYKEMEKPLTEDEQRRIKNEMVL
ncbi:chemotaxis protein CheW [Acetobacterium fimetarium]|uniref:Chemotaxis protein CheW n=2 Tax=Acetobacterium fimetarium TaxID=52691 RepID=A0ABR6WRN7_9FIRM|nr:chemotaxis protein CheW [Acetobacterium fimetarium]MBC3803192.1 chemotaxis protein CheW [Acetobacterium fimetarium]